MIRQRADLTFKENVKYSRHGWLRLTPAYSVKIVEKILDDNSSIQTILDPFSGSGTTGLIASQRGLACDLWDINPFLVWLAEVKCANYSLEVIKNTKQITDEIVYSQHTLKDDNWIPAISNIERWWTPNQLTSLANLFNLIKQFSLPYSSERNLLYIAFCQVMIRWSNASFNHQSVSFKTQNGQLSLFNEPEMAVLYQDFMQSLYNILIDAHESLVNTPHIFLQDARHTPFYSKQYDAIITSPPYVNRMSYIRELRPYMYWLGYLNEAKEAGELDWQAIGGTWGIATSRLNHWNPQITITSSIIQSIVEKVDTSSPILSKYIHKYFIDMSIHFANIVSLVRNGGQVYYVVGNSKFYDTLVPVEKIYAELLETSGFVNIRIEAIRKRNSKKELLEFLVSAQKP